MKKRFKRNYIVVLNAIGGELEKVEDVKLKTQNHFMSRFQEPKSRRPNFDGLAFKQLSEEESTMLEDHFLYEEIKEVVWKCDGEKNPQFKQL